MPKQTFKSDIKLGEKYRDPQTGVEGTATAIVFYQYACERATLEVIIDGGELKEYSFDAPRLESVKTGKRATTDRTGGPRGSVNQPSMRSAIPSR